MMKMSAGIEKIFNNDDSDVGPDRGGDLWKSVLIHTTIFLDLIRIMPVIIGKHGFSPSPQK